MTETSHEPSTPGGRIGLLLERSSIAPQAVADHMLLPAGVTLADVISGRYEPSLTELLAAADMLDVPVLVLTGKIPVEGHLGVSLRLGAVSNEREASPDLLTYADMLLRHRALLDAWHGQIENRLSSVPLSRDNYGANAGRVSAERVRAFLEVEDEPLGDLVGLIESLGIPVAFRELPANVHGLNVRDLRQGTVSRVIIVSTSDRWARQRYTLAHELCHALYDDTGQVIVDKVEQPEAVPEYRADSFARHLLLPVRALREIVTRSKRAGLDWNQIVPAVMLKYGISRDATVNALLNDGHAKEHELADIISVQVATLMRNAGLENDWLHLAQGEHEPTGSPSLVERAVQAYGNGWIGPEVVADLLDENVDMTLRLLSDAGWSPGR